MMPGARRIRPGGSSPRTTGDGHVPVVMVSARAGEESRIEGLQAGADDYIVKPFTARELVARVAARPTSIASAPSWKKNAPPLRASSNRPPSRSQS